MDTLEQKAKKTTADKNTPVKASEKVSAANAAPVKEKRTMTQEAVLHQWEISPYCSKIRKVLEAKNIPYSVVNYNGLRSLKAAKLSPVGKLPVLEIDGRRIQDSRKIAAYIEQNYTDLPLTPTDKSARADMEIYQDWADESLYWYEVFFRVKYKDSWAQASAMLSEGRSPLEATSFRIMLGFLFKLNLYCQGIGRYEKFEVEDRFKKLMDQLNAKLENRTWLVGESKTLADIAVAAQLQEILRTSHMAGYMRSLSNLNRWIQQV